MEAPCRTTPPPPTPEKVASLQNKITKVIYLHYLIHIYFLEVLVFETRDIKTKYVCIPLTRLEKWNFLQLSKVFFGGGDNVLIPYTPTEGGGLLRW